jgi:hypothetical protein
MLNPVDTAAPELKPLPRGVYIAPFTLGGQRYIYAVDERGEHLGSRTVPIGADLDPAAGELWDILEKRAPQLSLVRE